MATKTKQKPRAAKARKTTTKTKSPTTTVLEVMRIGGSVAAIIDGIVAETVALTVSTLDRDPAVRGTCMGLELQPEQIEALARIVGVPAMAMRHLIWGDASAEDARAYLDWQHREAFDAAGRTGKGRLAGLFKRFAVEAEESLALGTKAEVKP